MPDSLMVPPQFFFDQPTVPVEALIICAHGVFFNVHAPQNDKSVEYYVSFPVPTPEEYRQYVLQDTMLSARAATDPTYIDGYVAMNVAKHTAGLDELKGNLRRLLAGRYVEGQRIDLTSTPARLCLCFPLTLLWEKEAIPFDTYPGIYWRRE